MKKLGIAIGLVAACLVVGGTALASSGTPPPASVWSTPFTITRLTSYGTGYRVQGLTFPNPAGCTAPTTANPMPGAIAAQQDELSRTLLQAFLSGRPVLLYIGGICDGTAVTYSGVQIQ